MWVAISTADHAFLTAMNPKSVAQNTEPLLQMRRVSDARPLVPRRRSSSGSAFARSASAKRLRRSTNRSGRRRPW